MHGYLAQHPEIYMSPVKEPHHFGEDLGLVGPRYRYRDTAAYLSLFDGAGTERILGESSPGYLASESAPGEIHAFNPEARIVIMLRPPVDLVISLHQHNVAVGDEDLPLAEALEAEEDRARGRRLPRTCEAPVALRYRHVADLGSHLRRWLERFGHDAVHVIVRDDLVADPADVYRRLVAWLGVDAGFVPDLEVRNASWSPRSPRLERLARRPPPVLRAVGRRLGPPAVIARRLVRRWNTRPGRQVVPAELRRSLARELAGVVDDLSDVLGRDLSHWKGF